MANSPGETPSELPAKQTTARWRRLYWDIGRAFAAARPDRAFVQEVHAQIPWHHNLALLDKLDDPDVRGWYTRKARNKGWSRNGLLLQIGHRLEEYKRDVFINFPAMLSPAVSDMAARDVQEPIGLTERETRLVASLPEELKGSLPAVEGLEVEKRLAESAGTEAGHVR